MSIFYMSGFLCGIYYFLFNFFVFIIRFHGVMWRLSCQRLDSMFYFHFCAVRRRIRHTLYIWFQSFLKSIFLTKMAAKSEHSICLTCMIRSILTPAFLVNTVRPGKTCRDMQEMHGTLGSSSRRRAGWLTESLCSPLYICVCVC